MADKKKLFSSLKTLTVTAVAGGAIALTPVVAFAGEHDKGSCGAGKCSGKKSECTCSGAKKEECEKKHAEEHGDKASCSGSKCSGKK